MSSPKPCSDDVLRPFVVIDNRCLCEVQKCVITLNVTRAKKFSGSTDFVTMTVINHTSISHIVLFSPVSLTGGGE